MENNYTKKKSSINQQRRGWVPTSAVGECPRPCNPPQCRVNGECVVCPDSDSANALGTCSLALFAAASFAHFAWGWGWTKKRKTKQKLKTIRETILFEF